MLEESSSDIFIGGICEHNIFRRGKIWHGDRLEFDDAYLTEDNSMMNKRMCKST